MQIEKVSRSLPASPDERQCCPLGASLVSPRSLHNSIHVEKVDLAFRNCASQLLYVCLTISVRIAGRPGGLVGPSLTPTRAARFLETLLSPCGNHVICRNFWTPVHHATPIPTLKPLSIVPEKTRIRSNRRLEKQSWRGNGGATH